MKVYRKLHGLGSQEPPTVHFNTVVDTVLRILGSGSIDPKAYKSADHYAEKYLAYNLRRKEAYPLSGGLSPTARRQATLTGFLQRELLNRRINETFTFGYNPATGKYESDLIGLRLLNDVADVIRDIVGLSPCLDSVVDYADFGNGASASLVRSQAQRPRKFTHTLCATRGLKEFSQSLIKLSPIWSAVQSPHEGVMYADKMGRISSLLDPVKVVSGGVLDFVPKTSDIDRIIIKEPELNGFIQKGVGRLLREHLRRYTRYVPDGIDLDTSGALNSELAYAGSLHGHIGTVDGERASDSITIAAVERLFPPKWVELFMASRSPYCIINGKHHRLQMMSGMGNGFTFELESVIFYAIGVVCARFSKFPFAEQYVSIHGDDLTIPSDVLSLVRECYAALGITINKSKTFCDGPFRESCGGHFYRGHSVKPFYVRESTGRVRGDWFWLANSLLLWLSEREPCYLSSSKGRDLVSTLVYLRNYSRSFRRNPRVYVAPPDRSRRSGVYTSACESSGSSYRCLQVVDQPVKRMFTEEQSYVAWLHRPQVRCSPVELIFNKVAKPSYGFNDEVHERERWVRFNTWPQLDHGHWPSLWAAVRGHNMFMI